MKELKKVSACLNNILLSMMVIRTGVGGGGGLLNNKTIYCIVKVTFTVWCCALTLSKKKLNKKCTQTHQQPRGRGDDWEKKQSGGNCELFTKV